MQNAETKFEIKEKTSMLQEAARLGISRWTHPILYAPLYPIILVEGKYDCEFLEQAIRLLAPQKTIYVSYLERLQGKEFDEKGGIDLLKQYIKMNSNAIKARSPSSPVIVLLDWDSVKKVADFKKGFDVSDPFRVSVWPESALNPALEKSFRGIERCFSDRIINEANISTNLVATKQDGKKTIPKDADYDNFKKEAYKVVKKGLTSDDLIYVKDFLEQLLDSLEAHHEA